MFSTVNLVLGVMAILGGLLAARGYLPHLSLRGPSASAYLVRGLTISSFSIFPRIFVWDVLWRIDKTDNFVMSVGSAPINIVMNVVLLVGIWQILYARLLTIPGAHRSQYNIFTAPGYPGRILRFPRWK